MFVFNVVYNEGYLSVKCDGFKKVDMVINESLRSTWHSLSELVQYYSDMFVKMMWADKMLEIWGGEKYLKYIDNYDKIRMVKYHRVY